MLNSFRNFHSLFWSHGSRWLMFRAGYALRRRTGYLRVQMPAYSWKDRPLGTWLQKDIPSTLQAYMQWRKLNSPKFFFGEMNVRPDSSWNPHAAVSEAERILSGELKYFSHTYYQVGFPPDWHADPVSGIKLDSQKHWSEISDDPGMDIKFVWEPSRFGMVYPLVRAYASTRDERYAEAFWELIRSWAESNPPNRGPNWMDGQEAALRLLAWIFGFYAFFSSPVTTFERVAQFTILVASHAERIYKNIGYAISTHSNHSISEAFGLWLAGLLFPELKDSERYLSLGRKLLEQEAAAQILPDGSYSMYSLNYHRFILQIYFLAVRLGEIHQSPFSQGLKSRITKSIEALTHLIDPQNGRMPVYGSNDGALVLPLNDCDFSDYRPLLQLGTYLTKKQFLFEPGPWDEDVIWLFSEIPSLPGGSEGEDKEKTSFSDGGIYLLHGTNSKAIIRCIDHRFRPSHADQLHVDLWIRGQNIAGDAGTYLYSGKGIWRNGLAHTAVHNTVTVDRLDQMKMITRFTWTNWSHGRVLRHDKNSWQGEHDGYQRLPDPVMHRRTVLSLAEDRWLVLDDLHASRSHLYKLHWLLCDAKYGVQEIAPRFGLRLKTSDSKSPSSMMLIQVGILEGNGNFSIVRADPNSARGWRSRYYGNKEPAISVCLETEQAATCFWSYFGYETDKVEILNGVMTLTANEWGTSLDLNLLDK